MRNEINIYYREYLNNAQHHPKEYKSAHALFSIILRSNRKNNLVERLSKNKIPSVVYYKFPIHLMKAFKYLGYSKGDLPISESLSDSIISLPMHPYLKEREVNFIINAIQNKS